MPTRPHPLISVAIPAYKSTFLKQAINSVLKQSFENFELIIVNDASPEPIGNIVKSFDDPRIFYHRNDENLGLKDPTKNWNKCLKFVRGELFVLFADDDVYHRDFLKELYQLSIRYPQVNLFHCRVEQIDQRGRPINITPNCPEYEDALDFIWHRLSGKRFQFAADFMCRTVALKKNNGFYPMPLAWGSDDLTWFQLAFPAGVAYSRKPLCKFRVSDHHISSAGAVNEKLLANQEYARWMNNFTKTYIPSVEQNRIMIHMIEKEIKVCKINKDQSDILASAHTMNLFNIYRHIFNLTSPLCSRVKIFLKVLNIKFFKNINTTQ